MEKMSDENRCLETVIVNSWFQPLQRKLRFQETQRSSEIKQLFIANKMDSINEKNGKEGLKEKEIIFGFSCHSVSSNQIQKEGYVERKCIIKKKVENSWPVSSNSEYDGRTKTIRNNQGDSLFNSYPLKTRIYSAPPNVHLFSVVSHSRTPNPSKNSTDGKTSEETGTGRQQSITEGIKFSKKPLLCSKGSHSVKECFYPIRKISTKLGCPYQCKNCFRACLISSNRMKSLQQQKLINSKREQLKSKHYYQNIVQKAIRESQPIRKLVIGKNSF